MEQHDHEDRDGRFDLGAVFPLKGDPRRPPEWFGRGLLYTAIAVVVFVFVWNAWGDIRGLVLDVIIALFISLAVEPVVRWLVSHGWKRGAAAAISLVGLAVAACGLLVLFGSMFVQQLVDMVRSVPGTYDQIVRAIEKQTGWKVPDISVLGTEVFHSIKTETVTNFANQALSTTASLFSALLGVLTIALVTYYISAALPKMRRSLCQWIAPKSQERFLVVWTVVQDQVSNFLYSRIILAAISSTCMSVFLMVMKVSYWLPLSVFCGLVSQFVPTIGTYIGGALPVLSALGTNGWVSALSVLAYIIVYQQIENLLLSPMISRHTMDLNPAIAFLAVLALGSVFGALGAFLALPLTASFQAVFKAYTKRYELIDSPLLSDPKPVKKSVVVAGMESINEHVIKPVADHMPRAARGSSARVRTVDAPVDSELRYVRDKLRQYSNGHYVSGDHYSTQEELDESRTVAIPKHIVPENGKPDLNSPSGDDGQAGGNHPSGRAGNEGRGARGEWR